MLYLDYSRQPGQWVPNQFGGRENLDAVEFLKNCNHAVHTECPGGGDDRGRIHRLAAGHASSLFGRAGFSAFKWNMGWMHDTLNYFSRDSVFRKFHQNDLTFAMLYHHNENFT